MSVATPLKYFLTFAAVGFVVYWIGKVIYSLYRDLRYGPPEPPVVPRRMHIRSKRNRQPQQASHWTVNADVDDRKD